MPSINRRKQIHKSRYDNQVHVWNEQKTSIDLKPRSIESYDEAEEHE